MTVQPDHHSLFLLADSQHGYFTADQAHSCGFSTSLIRYHANTGKFVRVRRGLYRLRDYPSFYREHMVIAWLSLGKDRAVVSHESALDLYELSDVIPNSTHLTIPRTSNWIPAIPGTRIHTTSRPWQPGEIRLREGIPVTSPDRTIIDAAVMGTGPEQIEMAIVQALERGLTTPSRLRSASSNANSRVKALVEQSIVLARGA